MVNKKNKLEEIVHSKWNHSEPNCHLETEKKQLIELLRGYMPVQQERPIDVMKTVIVQAFKDIIGTYRWQIMLLLVLLTLAQILISTIIAPSITWVVLAPLPLFLVGWHAIQQSNQGMSELEATYKYTFQQLLFARMFVVCITSVVFYTILLLIFFLLHMIIWSFPLLNMSVIGVTPILLFMVIMLFMSIKYRQNTNWGMMLVIWACYGILSIYTDISDWFFHLHLVTYLFINIVLAGIVLYQLLKLWRLERIPYEYL